MGDWDPCACIFSHNAAMNRLAEILRNAQDACTDSECTDGQLPDEAGGMGTMTMMALWMTFAAGLYLMRPNSMRPQPNLAEKPADNSNTNNDRGPEPPAPSV
eukprot:m.335800 g.335800  ORF g.335800 m.335800 type:complete len:102 (+) comp17677_c0_seq1:220-525(+)